MKIDHSTIGSYIITCEDALYYVDLDLHVFCRLPRPNDARTQQDEKYLTLYEYSDIEIGKEMSLWTKMKDSDDNEVFLEIKTKVLRINPQIDEETK